MKVFVPKDNVNDETVIVQKIYKSHSQKVQKGDLIIDLETSKTAIEIESPSDGFITFFVKEEDEIPIGECLFEVLDAPIAEVIEENERSSDSKILNNYIFTKDAKNKIDELGITNYSFKKKMVSLDDVMKFINQKDNKLEEVQETKTVLNPDVRKQNPYEVKTTLPNVPFSVKKQKLRKRSEIKNLSNNGNFSTQSVIGIDVTTLPSRSYDVPFLFKNSIADLVTYETAKILKTFPELNSFYISENEFGEYRNINIGFSFDNDSNLKVLSIIDADKLSLKDTQKKISEHLELYESNQTIDEQTLYSSTITISDLSTTGSNFMLPLVSYNQSAIIGITRKNDYLSQIYIGFDHKVTSGLYVSKFLEVLKANIESHFFNEDIIKYLKCDRCEMTAEHAKKIGNSGFVQIVDFDGNTKKICENCFNGF